MGSSSRTGQNRELASRPPELPRRQIPSGLTRRELEILKLVAEGHSNAALARMLWLTEQTVKFHLSNVYRSPRSRIAPKQAAGPRNGFLGDELTVAYPKTGSARKVARASAPRLGG